MKTCSYCGAEYPDDAVMCATDHTPFPQPPSAPSHDPKVPSETRRLKFEATSLSAEDQQRDFVTLVKCPTLVEADLVASQLRAAGIEPFLPDESLMQMIGWNLNTFGYVRVQVAPKDFEAGRALLGGDGQAAL